MPETTPASNPPETPAERLERLIPVMGVENARRITSATVSDDTRERLARLVATAPQRLPS